MPDKLPHICGTCNKETTHILRPGDEPGDRVTRHCSNCNKERELEIKRRPGP